MEDNNSFQNKLEKQRHISDPDAGYHIAEQRIQKDADNVQIQEKVKSIHNTSILPEIIPSIDKECSEQTEFQLC